MPESVALYLAAAGMSEAAAAAVANALVATAASMVINAAATALTKKPGQRSFSDLANDRTVSVRAPIAPHRHVYGRVRVGGTIVAAASSGPRNQFMHMVIVLAAHEVEAIESIWFNDYVLTLNESGEETARFLKTAVSDTVTETFTVPAGLTVTLANAPSYISSVMITTDDPYVGVESYTLSGSTITLPATVPGWENPMAGQTVTVTYQYTPEDSTYVTVRKHLGAADQAADADIVAAFPGEWTENHRLRGRAYLYVRLEYSQDLFPYGLPNISAVVQGKKVYDPRTATTAYSANAALCIADYLNTALGASYSSEIDTTQLAAAANICDESVVLAGGGTEHRYECHGTIDLSQRPREIIGKLLTSCGGRATFVAGKWRIIPAAYSTPTVTLTESHLRGPLRVQSIMSRRDLCNGVKGIYISERNAWQPADIPPVTNATYLAEDGERIWRDVELPFTVSAACAQRLEKIELERARQQITVTTTVSLIGLQITPGDTIALTNARMGWTAKAFEVTSWRFVSDSGGGLAIELSLRETASAVFNWNNGEESTIDDAPDTNLWNPWYVAPPTALSFFEFSAPTNGQNVLGLGLTWTASAEATVVQYEVQGRATTTPDWQSFLVSGSTTYFEYMPATAGATYQARVRAISAAGVRSAWASATDVTVSGIPAPTGLALTQTSQTDASGVAVASLLATWTASTARDVVSYEVSGKLSTDSDWYGQGTVTETRFSYQPIVAGLTYQVRVRAVNRDGMKSPWTATVSYTAATIAAPTGVTVSATTASGADGTVVPALKVAWTASTSANVSGYEVQGKFSTDATWSSFTVAGRSTEYIHPVLIAGATYNVRVRSIAGDGTFSAWANASDFTAAAIAPPTGLAVAEVTETAGDGTKIARLGVTWTASTSTDVVAYEVQGKFAADVNYASFMTAGAVTRYVHPVVVPGATYNVRVRAISSTGIGSAWTAVTTYTAADIAAPTNVSVGQTTSIAPDGTVVPRLLVTWTASTSGDVAQYEVQGKLSTDTDYASFVVAGNVTRYVHPVVLSGVTYNVRVRSISTSGVGSAWSTVVNYSTTGDTTAPGAPSGLAATGGLRSVRLVWTNPTDADYAYTEVWEHTSDARASATKVGQVSGTNWVRSDLATGATRYYWIRAVDFSGNVGAWNATAGVSATTSSVATGDISSGAVTTALFASGIRPVEIVSTLPSSGNTAGRVVFLTTDNKLYRYDGSAWTAAVPAVDVTGQITTTQITDSAISTAKLSANAVTTAKLATGAVTADTIAANAITAGKIAAAAISSTEIAAGSISVDRLSSSSSAFNSITFALGSSTTLDGRTAAAAFTGTASAYGILAKNTGGKSAIGAGTTATTNLEAAIIGVAGTDSTFAKWKYQGQLGNGTCGGLFGSYDTSMTLVTGIDLARAAYAYYVTAGAGGPFTGSHDAAIPRSDAQPEVGDIIVDTGLLRARDIFNAICTNAVSTAASQKGVVGVFAAYADDTHVPAALLDGEDPCADYGSIAATHRMAVINSVGEGLVNVCSEGGDIAIGDLIVTSSLPGKGMRQSDDIVRATTVAKAREAVAFAGPADVKQIACIYLCG